jgi:hypothetical protein
MSEAICSNEKSVIIKIEGIKPISPRSHFSQPWKPHLWRITFTVWSTIFNPTHIFSRSLLIISYIFSELLEFWTSKHMLEEKEGSQVVFPSPFIAITRLATALVALKTCYDCFLYLMTSITANPPNWNVFLYIMDFSCLLNSVPQLHELVYVLL